jgi:hypothetical protein
MSLSFYYADANAQPVGPLSLDEIRRFVAAGVIPPDVLVCEADGEVWRPLHDHGTGTSKTPPPQARRVATVSGATPDRTYRSLHAHLSHAVVAVVCTCFVETVSRIAAGENGGSDPNGMHGILTALIALWAVAAELILVFHICRALPNHLRFTTPAKAAWFLIIPGFNIYWAFRLLPGFADSTVQWDREAASTAHQRNPAPNWLRILAYASAVLVAVSTVLVLLELVGVLPVTDAGLVVYLIDYGLRFTFYATVVGVMKGILVPAKAFAHVSMALTDDGKTPKVLLWVFNRAWPKIWGCLLVVYIVAKILELRGVIDL